MRRGFEISDRADRHDNCGRKALMQRVGVSAELKQVNLGERTNAGVQAAETKEVKFGRRQKLTESQRLDIVYRVSV